MKFLFAIFVVAIAMVVDPLAYLPFHTPKNFLFISLVPLLLVWQWYSAMRRSNRLLEVLSIEVTVVEVLLVIRLLWVVASNPAMVFHPSDMEFWILLSLTLLTIAVRQVAGHSTQVNKEKNTLAYFLRAVWLCGFVQAGIGLWQLWSAGHFDTQVMKTPMIGTIGAANGYGLFLVLGITAAITDAKVVSDEADVFMSSSRFWRIAKWIAAAVMMAALVLNGSRGAMLGLMSGVAVVLAIVYRQKFSALTLSVRIGIIVLAVAAIAVVGAVLAQQNVESSFGRLMVWNISLPMITEHPVLGVGHGRYAVEYLNYQAKYFQTPEHLTLAYKAANLKQAHNEYLQAFCESGVIGGLFFAVIWVMALWSLINYLRMNGSRDRNSSNSETDSVKIERSKMTSDTVKLFGVLAMLVAVLVHAVVDTPLHVLPVSVIVYTALGFVPVRADWTWRIGTVPKTSARLTQQAVGWIVLAVLCGYASWMLMKTWMQYSAYRSWERGARAAQSYQWAEAIDAYQDAGRALPEKGELEFHLGSAMVMSGAYSKGLYHLETSLKGFNDRNVWLSMSYAHLQLRNWIEAERTAKAALGMFPDHLAPHLLLGEIYHGAGDIEKSKAALLKCIRRETQIQSSDVTQTERDARMLWQKFYDDDNNQTTK